MKRTIFLTVLAVCVAGVVRQVAAGGENGLVARFALDEGEGEKVAAGNNPALSGAMKGAYWRESGNTVVAGFDGTDDYIDFGDPDALDITGPISVGAWVYADEIARQEVGIVGKHFTSYLISFYSNGNAYWYIGSGGNAVMAGLPVGKWTHLVGTFDGQRSKLYVNGALAAERASKFDTVPSGGRFTAGCFFGQEQAEDNAYIQSGFFKGAVGDVRVYDRALDAGEIAAMYEEGDKGRFEPVPEPCERLDGGASIAKAADGGLGLAIADDGEMMLTKGDSYCLVRSSFSYPDGGEISYFRLGEAKKRPQPVKPRVSRLSEGRALVTATLSAFNLERVVTVLDGRVRIEDRLTNLTKKPLGILVDNQAITPETLTNQFTGSPSAPFAFASQPGYDIGVTVKDFVSRAHFSSVAENNSIGFGVQHFALRPGASHVIAWSISLLEPAGDVHDLVNQVRERWGVNHTLLGPCSFFDITDNRLKDPVALKEYLKRRNLKIAMMSPWLDYDPGQSDHVYTRDEYKAMMKDAVARLKAADPDILVGGCIETDWITIFPDQVDGFEKLPVHSGDHTGHKFLDEEQKKVILSGDYPWKDSVVHYNEPGRIRVELYSRGGKPQIALNVLPAPGNYQEKFLSEQVRFMVDEVGMDGFYIDEFYPFWYRDHRSWDGYTCDIDPRTGEITQTYSHPGILGRESRLKLCRMARDEGLFMVANTYAADTEVAQLPTMRFAETQGVFHTDALPMSGKPLTDKLLTTGWLGTPIGLGLWADNTDGREAELLMRAVITYLRHGMVYYHYVHPDLPQTGPGSGGYGPVNQSFPITPVRLFEGGIVGRERTLTCLSGTYRWAGENKPTVTIFDRRGMPKMAPSRAVRDGDGWKVEITLDDWNEVGVIAP